MRGTPRHKELRRTLRHNATLAERLLWSTLRNRQTGYKFRRQETIGPFIVDFFCPGLKLVIELDGIHHSLPDVHEYDKKREIHLKQAGYRIIRYSTDEVIENLDGVTQDIMKHCSNIDTDAPL